MEIETQAQRMETMMKQLLVKHPAPNRNTANGMGGTHEQLEIDGKRGDSQGDHLQLDLEFNNEETGGEEHTLPPFPMQYLPTLLREDIGLTKKKDEIAQYFKEHTDDEVRATFYF